MTDSERLARIETICAGMAETLALLVQAIAADQCDDDPPKTDLDGNPTPMPIAVADSL